MISNLPQKQTRWDLIFYVMRIKPLSKNLVRFVQFNIHSCFNSAAKSAHAITEAGSSGHCLDSSGKSME